MKKSIQLLNLILAVVLTSFSFTACVDKKYDDLVTANVDPDITPTHTIQQLQAMATGSTGVEITSDIIVSGIVIADDSSGNIYKKVIIQQDLSGISIQVDISNFYTEYPVGRRIFVKCKGLFIANNGGNIELGTSPTNPVGRIPANLLSKYIVKGKWGQYLTPTTYLLDDPNIPTNTLVQFNDVEFEAGDNGVAWAASSPSNLVLEDCAAVPHNMIVYSSVYATFALQRTPVGKGSITGVYTVYGGAGELQIRDLKDVNMDGLRCDGSTGMTVQMPLDSVRMLDPGPSPAQIYLPGDKKIVVTVTSNYTSNMLYPNNCYVQDGTAGINIFFTSAHTFAIGTQIEVNISGLKLANFNGVLEITAPLGNAIPVGTGSVTPRTATIADINANYNSWEAQVVKIDNVTISGSGTYGGSNTLSDGTGSIQLYTSSSATFALDTYPTGTVSVTGILSEYNGGKEILIRNPTLDVQ